jgi:hypothetical protein
VRQCPNRSVIAIYEQPVKPKGLVGLRPVQYAQAIAVRERRVVCNRGREIPFFLRDGAAGSPYFGSASRAGIPSRALQIARVSADRD